MKRCCLLLLACFCSFSSAATKPASHAIILQYHHVSTTTPHATSISPAQLSEHLQWLKDNNFQVWPLPKIISTLQHNSSDNKVSNILPDRVVAITFDDGYHNNYQHAYPLLKKFNYPFTIFLNTKPVNDAYKSHLNWLQIKEMSENGATIANHTKTHPYMLRLNDNETAEQWHQRMKDEIISAETSIEQHTGQSEKLFAYPYGESSPQLRGLLRSMGYTSFAQYSGPISSGSNFSQLPRFALSGNYTNLDSFAQKMLTLPLPISEVTAIAEINDGVLPYSNKRPALKLVLEGDAIKASVISCFASGQGAMDIEVLDSNKLTIRPRDDIPVGRSRYNCTARVARSDSNEAVRFHWFSYQWIRLGEQNQWQHH